MGKVFDAIDDALAEFLSAQPVFFVATAPSALDGHVNVSPKGLAGSFAVLDPRTVAYLDLTGSGAETVAHLRDNGRVCLMFCAFAGPPKIVRLHGRGEAILADDPRFPDLVEGFATRPGIRSVVRVAVERVSDSCGFAVPLMAYHRDRDQLPRWAEQKGEAALVEYRREKNSTSIDGLPAVEQGVLDVAGNRVVPRRDGPLHAREIHARAEEILGQPVPWSSLKDCLSVYSGGDHPRFLRVRRGWYARAPRSQRA